MSKILSSKDPAEIVTVTFDFENEFPGATLTGPDIDIAVEAGTDPTPATVLLGAPQVQAQKVLQQVQGGVAFTDYHLTCFVTVGGSQVAVRSAVLPVRDA